MDRLILMATIAALLATPAVGQTNIYVPDDVPGAGTCNVIPFGQSSTFSNGYTYLARIPSSFLDPMNPVITDIAFAPCGSGTWSSALVTIAFGHVPNPQPCPFSFPDPTGATMGSFTDLTVVQAAQPFTWTGTANTWSAWNLNTSFNWNGTDDVGFFFTFQTSTVTGWNGACHRSSTIARTYSSGYGAATSATCLSNAALKMCLSVSPGGPVPCFLQVQGNPGTGGGFLALSSIDPAVFEGATLVSLDTVGPVGAGPLQGLYPDFVTDLIIAYVLGGTAGPGDPFHWTNAPNVFPNAPLAIPPGTFAPNAVVDFLVAKLSPAGISATNVARGTF